MPMIAAAHARLIRQLETIAVLDNADRAAISTLPLRLRSVEKNRDILREGQSATDCCLILEGFACRYKMLPGGRRQIVSFHFAGDLPDLQSLSLSVMDHSLAALTRMQVAFIPHDAVRTIIRLNPGVADALSKHALIDASVFREWIANVGRRTALQRIAHLLCECFARMSALGLTHDMSMQLSLTQSEIGDATGLSNVHVNRTLMELRRLSLIQTIGNRQTILDWPGIQEVAGFNPAYLHLRTPPSLG